MLSVQKGFNLGNFRLLVRDLNTSATRLSLNHSHEIASLSLYICVGSGNHGRQYEFWYVFCNPGCRKYCDLDLKHYP